MIAHFADDPVRNKLEIAVIANSAMINGIPVNDVSPTILANVAVITTPILLFLNTETNCTKKNIVII